MPERILVCGGRDFDDVELMGSVLNPIARRPTGIETVLVHGDARGADRLAASMWETWGCPTEAHPANWDLHGKYAGPIRNQKMLDTGIDLVIAFAGGRGTADMVRRARAAGVEVMEVAPVKDEQLQVGSVAIHKQDALGHPNYADAEFEALRRAVDRWKRIEAAASNMIANYPQSVHHVERKPENDHSGRHGVCNWCGQPFPCDTALLVQALA